MPYKITRKPEGMAPIRKFTSELKARYCEKLAVCGLLAKSAHALGISHHTVETHRREDPLFKQATEQALALYRDSIEQEVHARAITGWQEPVVYQGKVSENEDGTPVTVLKKSDRLLELHAKRHINEYRDKFEGEINIKGGVLVVGAQLTTEQWQEKFGGVKHVENEAQPPPQQPAGPLPPLNPAPGTEPGSVRLEPSDR